MKVEDESFAMARSSFGYGCWKSNFWFIGPEQGMSRNEEDLQLRLAAWLHLGSRDLDGCREFHTFIEEYRWHGTEVKQPVLQKSWGKLILTLLSYKGLASGLKDRIAYQSSEWGELSGETCVIELSGLAAHDAKVERDRHSFLAERTETISDNIALYKPEFVLLYGRDKSCKRAWDVFAARAAPIHASSPSVAITKRLGPTLLAWMPHPVSYGQTAESWSHLGRSLREVQDTDR